MYLFSTSTILEDLKSLQGDHIWLSFPIFISDAHWIQSLRNWHKYMLRYILGGLNVFVFFRFSKRKCLQMLVIIVHSYGLVPKTVELNEMGVLSLTSIETVSYQITAK